MSEGIQFSELLDYTELEHGRWKQFFMQHPEALDLPCDVAGSGTIRELVFHIFAVNLNFAHMMLGLERPDFKTLPHATLKELFAIDEEATRKLRGFLKEARAEDWATKASLGFIKKDVSKRKMMSQALLHGVHHRAQLATSLRQQGLKQDWIHDLVLSDVMD
jgi:uncharacterized damage-inducible protein DinB